uniref:Uncharacterized protein n=1 Tax=Oryctolagus cuniculus TaxID=9986 RepID=G1U3M7_RABIT
MKSVFHAPSIQMYGIFRLYRLSEMKQWICKLIGLFFSYLSWAFGVSLVNSRSWRVWEFDSQTVPFVFIGFWEAFYYKRVNISGSVTEVPMSSTINASWVISTEIEYGRDLIVLPIFMKTTVLIFSTVAVLVSWIKAPYPEFIQMCYKISVFFLFTSCGCTFTVVIWNFIVDFYGQSTLDFPLTFPVDKEILIRKHFSYVFPAGISTATLSLVSATMFLCELCLAERRNRVKPLPVDDHSKEKV